MLTRPVAELLETPTPVMGHPYGESDAESLFLRKRVVGLALSTSVYDASWYYAVDYRTVQKWLCTYALAPVEDEDRKIDKHLADWAHSTRADNPREDLGRRRRKVREVRRRLESSLKTSREPKLAEVLVRPEEARVDRVVNSLADDLLPPDPAAMVKERLPIPFPARERTPDEEASLAMVALLQRIRQQAPTAPLKEVVNALKVVGELKLAAAVTGTSFTDAVTSEIDRVGDDE